MTERASTLSAQDLQDTFGWQVEATNGEAPELVYLPLAPHSPTVIHEVQAMGCIMLVRSGAEVVIGVEDGEVRDDLKRSFKDWFAMADVALPSFVALDAWNAAHNSGEVARPYPRHGWAIAQDRAFHSCTAGEDLRTLKIAPANIGSPEILEWALAPATKRLDTPRLVWPHLHGRLQDVSPSAVMTLSGSDERDFWHQWDDIYGQHRGNLSHLYLPAVTIHNEELLSWGHEEDLFHSLRQAANVPGREARGQYFRWMLEQACLLPMRVLGNIDAMPETWEQLAANIDEEISLENDETPVLQDVARYISRTFLRQLS